MSSYIIECYLFKKHSEYEYALTNQKEIYNMKKHLRKIKYKKFGPDCQPFDIMDYCCQNDHVEILKYLDKKYSGPIILVIDLIETCCRNRSFNCFDYLVETYKLENDVDVILIFILFFSYKFGIFLPGNN